MFLQKYRGMTLLELLISIAIVGVLGAIVYPSYTSYLIKSDRTEAQRELVNLANKMEQYFIDHRTYTPDMRKLGMAADPYITSSGKYSIDTSVQTTSTFTLKATARGTQATNDKDCTTLSIDHTGKRTAESASCWER